MNEETQFEIGLTAKAIIPVKDMRYQSLICDCKGNFNSTGTPIQLIKEVCRANQSTYEGRRECVTRFLGYNIKTPIPISPNQLWYAFPTMSPKQYECIWLFLHQIAKINIALFDSNQTDITFYDGTHLVVDTPIATIRNQIERTLVCSARFSHPELSKICLSNQAESYAYSKSEEFPEFYIADEGADYDLR